MIQPKLFLKWCSIYKELPQYIKNSDKTIYYDFKNKSHALHDLPNHNNMHNSCIDSWLPSPRGKWVILSLRTEKLNYLIDFDELFETVLDELWKSGIAEPIEYDYDSFKEPIKMFCTFCKKQKESMKKCSRCKLNRYCSRECQKNDWKEHKTICKEN